LSWSLVGYGILITIHSKFEFILNSICQKTPQPTQFALGHPKMTFLSITAVNYRCLTLTF